MRGLVDGKDVLAVLPTCYPVVMARASSIKCSFADYELDGQAAIFMISFPLISIIKDQISEMKSIGYSAILIASIVWNAGMRRMHACLAAASNSSAPNL